LKLRRERNERIVMCNQANLIRNYVETGLAIYCDGRVEPELIRAELEFRAQVLGDASLAEEIAAGCAQLGDAETA
jgi:uncharacterized protein YifN (PemK superfamily)